MPLGNDYIRGMKRFALSLFLLTFVAAIAAADIQSPPMADYGVTRKMGRGLANIFFGWSEIPHTIATVNSFEGNAAGATYGVVRGTGRAVFRFAAGWYEFLLAPFPLERSSYRPPYRDTVPWIHSGYQEFPPELGWESRFHYTRANTSTY